MPIEADAGPDEGAETESDVESLRETWSLLRAAARPYRRQFAWIAFLALLATAAGLVEPIIYRAAINDISGLFVGQRGERGIDALLRDVVTREDQGEAPPPRAFEPHGRGHVAARTPTQALHTLLTAVVLLFLVDVVS